MQAKGVIFTITINHCHHYDQYYYQQIIIIHIITTIFITCGTINIAFNGNVKLVLLDVEVTNNTLTMVKVKVSR